MITWEQVSTFVRVVVAMFNPSAEDFAAHYAVPGSFEMALTVAALAGLSETVGESAVLFINRVRVRRFLLSLVISAAIFVVTYLFLTVSIATVARVAFDSAVDLRAVATLVGLSYAPRLFGFLAFLPYFGVPLSVLLNLLTVLVMTRSVAWTLDLAPLEAGASVLLGTLLLVTLQRSIGRPVTAAARWLMRRAAGVPLVTDRTGLTALLDDRPDLGLRSGELVTRYRPPAARLRRKRHV